jgi:dUTP pyrophosphatase
LTEIKIKRLSDLAKIPTKGSDSAAGYDLYCANKERVVIKPYTNGTIGTGLSIEIPDGYFGAIFARSGLASKEGLRPANCVGVCDSDYRGEYKIALFNDSEKVRIVEPGERVAQLVVIPYLPVEFKETTELSETERGDGGFGSTGRK